MRKHCGVWGQRPQAGVGSQRQAERVSKGEWQLARRERVLARREGVLTRREGVATRL